MTGTFSEARSGSNGYHSFPLDVAVQRHGVSTLVVEVAGELDLATAPTLKQHLEPYDGLTRTDAHPQAIVYHLANLSFIDATGLTALLTAVDGHGPSTITVRQPSPQVRRLLGLVGLESMIETEGQETVG